MESPIFQHLVAGATAGLVSTVLLHPLDLIKVRYQVHEGSGSAYSSVLNSFRIIIHNEGMKGLYQGMAPAVIASAVSWGGYFYFYESFKKYILLARKQYGVGGVSGFHSGVGSTSSSPVDHLLAGIAAGAMMVLITNPLWLAKTRLQLQGLYQNNNSVTGAPCKDDSKVKDKPISPFSQSNASRGFVRYRGMTDTLYSIIREEGVLALYKGLVPSLLLTLNGALQMMVYEYLKVSANFLFYQNNNNGINNEPPAYMFMVMGGLSKVISTITTYPYQVVKSRLQQRIRLGPGPQPAASDSSLPPFAGSGSGTSTSLQPPSQQPLHQRHVTPSNSNSYSYSNSNSTSSQFIDSNSNSSSSRGRSPNPPWTTPPTTTSTAYKGTIDCLLQIWKYEGMSGFFKGLVPHCLRVAPSAALTFVVYEECLKYLKHHSKA